MSMPEKVIAGVKQLDPLPETAQRLMSAVMDEDVAFGDLSDIVEQDEAIASNLLREVNSANSASARSIDSVRQAVVRVGLAGITEIVLGFQLRGLTVDAPMYDLTEHEMWRHSVCASAAARSIRSHSPVSIPNAAATAALVHDIGKLVMVRHLEGSVDELLELCDREGATWIEAERAVFGCDHAEVGAAIADAWNFPEAVRDAIARHHDDPIEDSTPLIDTTVLANFVCRTIGVGLGAAGMNLSVDQGVLDRLKLDYDAFCLICAETAHSGAEV